MLFQASLASSDALRPDQEARSSASSGSAESMLLACSSSEEIEKRKLYRVTSLQDRHPPGRLLSCTQSPVSLHHGFLARHT